MNDTVTPEVEAFVAAVQARLADLPEEVREELAGGLDADLADLVSDRGPGALGDPAAYADELRAAAGLSPYDARAGRAVSVNPGEVLDAVHERWDLAVARIPGDAAGILKAAQPAWWVARAWIAVMLVSQITGPWATDVPWLPTGSWGVGLLVVALAAVLSIQIGRGLLWPGTRRHVLGRLLLIGLNLFAFLVAFNVVQNVRYDIESRFYTDVTRSAGEASIYNRDGLQICNLQPYDAAGRPLQGVQLFDESGRPFDVRCPDRYGTGAYPWMLGDVARWNVFPQAERRQSGEDRVRPDAYDSARPPAFPAPRRADVPPVAHPLVAGTPEPEALDREQARKKQARTKQAGQGEATRDRRPISR